MGIFDIKKREKVGEELSSAQLGSMIVEKKKQLEQLKKDIDVAKQENEQLEVEYMAKIKELEDKQEYFNSRIEEQKTAYASRIDKIVAKKQSLVATHEEKISALKLKLQDLEDKERDLYAQKSELKAKEYQTKQDALKERIARLKENLKTYNAEYDANLNEVNEKYNELLTKKEKDLDALNIKKSEFIVQANTEIDKLEQEKAKLENYHQDQLRRLEKENESIAAITKSQEESSIREKEKELASVSAEVKSLQNFRNSLVIDLDNARTAHSREYATLISKFESEKENLLRETDLLKSELDTKQKEYEETSKEFELDYNYRVKELNTLFDSLKNENAQTTRSLDEKLKENESEITRKYQDFVDKLENEFVRENKARQEELNNLKFELEQEEENAKHEKEFLDKKLQNTSDQLKASVKDKAEQLARVQDSLNSLEKEHIDLVAGLNSKIAEIKQKNAADISAKEKEYEIDLAELKEQYAVRRADINKEIDSVKENIKVAKAASEDAKKELNEFKEQKAQEKADLLNSQHEYIESSRRQNDDITKKIDEVKSLMAANNQTYKENLEKLNKRKSDIEKAAESKIADLNVTYQNKVLALENNYNNNVDQLTKNHNARILKLDSEFDKQIHDVTMSIDTRQRELEDYNRTTSDKMEALRQSSERRIASLEEQNKDINSQIEDIKARMDNENEAYDNQVKTLESEYLFNLDKLAKVHNEGIQKILAEYEEEPSKELEAIRKDYEAIQREYSNNIDNIEASKRKLIDAENDLKRQIQTERESYANEIKTKTNDLERIQRENESQQEQINREINRLKDENENVKLANDEKVATLQREQQSDFERYASDLKQKIDELQRNYNEKEERVIKQHEDDLKATKFDGDNRILNINALIDDIRNKRETFEAQYQDKYDEAVKQVNNSKALLVDLEAKRRKVFDEYNISISEIKKNNADAITVKQGEYEDTLRETKEEYTRKRHAIQEQIGDVKSNIEAIRQRLVNANQEFEEYKQANEDSVKALTNEYEQYISYTNKQKADIEEQTAAYKKTIKESKAKYDDDVRVLELERAELKRRYEKEVEEIKRNYSTKTAELEQAYSNSDKEITSEYQQRIDKHQEDYNRRLYEIKSVYDARQNEYTNLKANLQNVLDSIQTEYEAKIHNIDEQKTNINDTIDNLRLTIENEKVKYFNTIKSLGFEKDAKLQEMAKQYNSDIETIIEDNYNVPSRELRDISDKFNQKQKEYNARIEEIERNRKTIDDEIYSIENHNQLNKKTIESEITNLTGELDRTKAECEKVTVDLHADIQNHQNELDAYKQETENLIRQAKENSAANEKTYIARLEADHQALIKSLSEEEKDEQNKLNDSIIAIEADLNDKKSNLDTLIRDIEAKKDDFRNGYSDQYEKLVKETNDVREALVHLQKEHDEKVEYFKNSIEALAKENDEAIEVKRKEYQNSVNKTKKEYEERKPAIFDEIDNTKKNIARLENQISVANRDYATYAEDANARKQAIIDAHTDYVRNATKSISDINEQISNIKKEIVSRQETYNADIEKLNINRRSAQDAYDQTIKEIDRIYANRIDELNQSNNKRISDVKDAHLDNLKKLKIDYTERVKQLEDSYENKKDEYRILKKNYHRDLAQIKEECKNKIESLENQEKDIRSSIRSLEGVMSEEKGKYDQEIKTLNDRATGQLLEMERVHNETISGIVYENETLPTKMLEEVKGNFARIQNEYDGRILDIANSKKAIDETEYAINSKNNEERNRVDTELALRTEQYTKLKVESENKNEEYARSIKERKKELQTFNKDSDFLSSQYRENKEAEFIALSKDLDAGFKKLKENQAVNIESTTSTYNNQIASLQMGIDEKIALVDRKINVIFEEQSKVREVCDAELAKKTSEHNEILPVLQKQLDDLKAERIAKAEFYKDDLDNTEKGNRLAIDRKHKELEDKLANAKEEYLREKEGILARTEDTHEQIGRVQVNLAKANKDFEEYRQNSESRNRSVLEKQAEYLRDIDKQKAAIDEKINDLNAEMMEKQRAYDHELEIINGKRQEAQNEYDAKIREIENEYLDKTTELKNQNNEQIAVAQGKHDAIIQELKNDFEIRTTEIKNSFELKKQELKDRKSRNKDDIRAIKENIQQKIAELENEQNALIDKINETKAIMKRENDAYNEEAQKLQAQFDQEVKTITDENTAKIKDINHTYVEIPNIELARVTGELSSKQNEYESAIQNYENKKLEFDNYEKSIMEKFDKFKVEANANLDKKRNQYEETYNKLKQQEYTVDENLNKEKKALEQLRLDIDRSVEDIKNEKVQELVDYNTKLDKEYAEKEAYFKSIQDTTANQNEKEIAALQAHLDSKRSNIDSLLQEIGIRKKQVEDDKSVRYNDAVAQTNKLRSDLDNIVADSAMKKTEYENELATKKKDNALAIEKLKQDQIAELEKTKYEAQETSKRRQKEIEDIQKEIVDLSAKKDSISQKLTAYVNEKNASVKSINEELKEFTKNVNTSIQELAIKRNELEESHQKRIDSLKEQIAQSISEYDDLMKLKPKLISDAYDEKIDFVSIAKTFKDKLESLEQAHNNIIDELEANRVETLDKIAKEIANIDETKPEKLKTYEDEITNLSLTYDAMLREEKAKHATLEKNLAAANRERQKIEEATYQQREQIGSDFRKRQEILNNEFNKVMASSKSDLDAISSKFKNEFNELAKKRDYLSDRLVELGNGFIDIDNQIHQEIIGLKSTYNEKLIDIQNQYNAKVQSNRDRLKAVDMMNTNASILFKK